MNERLSTLQVVALLSYAVGMAAGQVLFKLAAWQMTPDGGLFERVLSLSLSPYFLSALVLYLVLSGIWVWILSFTAISQAYLFAILSVALVPLLGFVIFSEPVSTRLVIGLLIILAGLFVVAG